MTALRLLEEQRPGCGDKCARMYHDPDAHEAYGYQRGVDEERQARAFYTIEGRVTIDVQRQSIWVDGDERLLTPIEWKIAKYLLDRVDRWCPMQDMLAAIWDWGDITPEDSVLRTNITRLRQKIKPFSAIITNRPGTGYRLVSRLADATPGAKTLGAKWARDYDQCQDCGTSTKPHFATGRCSLCWSRTRPPKARS